MKSILVVSLALLMSACSSTPERAGVPDGLSNADYMMCQYFGALYGLIATGRNEHKLSELQMMAHIDNGIDDANVSRDITAQLKAWGPAAVYRVYQSPGKITSEEWEKHVEAECLDRVESDSLKRVLRTALDKNKS